MSYCQKKIMKTALLRSLTPIILFVLLLGFAISLPEKDRKLNELYRQQAEQTGLEQPALHADSSKTASICYGISGVLLLMALFPLSKILIPQTSGLAKSIKRYEKYEGEGNIMQLMEDVNQDLAHAPVFGSIAVGNRWIGGKTGIAKNEVVNLDRLRAVFWIKLKKQIRGESGITKSIREYALILLDDRFRVTVLNTSKENDMMSAYHMLLRNYEALIHGNFKDYTLFLEQGEAERERAFRRVANANYEENYFL